MKQPKKVEIVEHKNKMILSDEDITNAIDVMSHLGEDRTVVEAYLKDETTTTNLKTWANYMAERFSNNWFTISQVMKKTPLVELQVATQTLGLLILKGLCHRENRHGVMKFKICLDINDKIKLLQLQLEDLKKHEDLISTEIARLQKEAALLVKK